MKKTTLIILLITLKIIFASAQAQTDTGIYFSKASSWNEILEKAKAEHKYIFVDCYATWCGPCKLMEQSVYPLKEVGDVYNKDFISVKLQMDKTPEDNGAVKNWYDTATDFANNYNVNAYPTFLFFDPGGKPVHKFTGVLDAAGLIQLAKDAQDPDKQFYAILKNFEAGKLDTTDEKGLAQALFNTDNMLAGKMAADYLSRIPVKKLGYKPTVFLMANLADNPEVAVITVKFIQSHDLKTNLSFISFLKDKSEIKTWAVEHIGHLKAAQFRNEGNLGLVKLFSGEPKVQQAVKHYLDGLTDAQLYTKINIQYLALANQTAADIRGFEVFYSHAGQVDNVMGIKGYAHDRTEAEIKQAEFTPLIEAAKQNGVTPDFDAIAVSITTKYKGNFADDIIVRGKLEWYGFLVSDKKEEQYWPELNKSYVACIERFSYDTVPAMFGFINGVAWDGIYIHSNDQTQIEKAAKWMAHVVELNKDRYTYLYMDTYVSLLYKAGQTDKALEWANKDLQIVTDLKLKNDIVNEQDKIAAMQKGDKIWLEKEFQ